MNTRIAGMGMGIVVAAVLPHAGLSAEGLPALDRAAVLASLQPRVESLLRQLEGATGLTVRFEALPDDARVLAQYSFGPDSVPRVQLRKGWEDHDIAHELLHMKMQLVDRYSVPALRRNTVRAPGSERAEVRLRSVVDDQIIHVTLTRMGFAADGEVIKPPLFDDICVAVPRQLEQGAKPESDGLSHMDKDGYGDVMRVSTLVQVELTLRDLAGDLPPDRIRKLEHFRDAFRKHRPRESAIADQVLALFKENDLFTFDGHFRILWGWMKIAGLDRFSGPGRFEKKHGRYILPWPSDP